MSVAWQEHTKRAVGDAPDDAPMNGSAWLAFFIVKVAVGVTALWWLR